MEYLLQAMRVDHFEPLLRAYRDAGVPLGSAIDGGAGMGYSARRIHPYVDQSGRVYAYEPFPGNHRVFDPGSSRVELRKKALYDRSRRKTLSVRSVVPEDSRWGRLGRAGYSSAGHIVDSEPANDHDIVVECVRADEDLPRDVRIGFVKLDLQGGELDALRGMSGFLQDVPLMWIEYMLANARSPDVYRHLVGNGFLVFDTEYLFRGDPTDEALEHFELARRSELSNGATVWFGFKREPWGDFAVESAAFASRFNMRQTDICCINRRYLREFLTALPLMIREAEPTS